MTEEQIRKTPCWICAYKEYDSRFSPSGKYYREWQCFYPQHRHQFGRIKAAHECPDFEDESAVDARMGGGL